MKQILVYGDSNTWGQDNNGRRYTFAVQWPNQLEQLLDVGYRVISAGLPGRVAGSYEHIELLKRGKDAFGVIYRQASPVDVLIIALGTNDVKKKYNLSVDQIYEDLLWYKKMQRNADVEYGRKTQLLYIAPPNFVYSEKKFAGDMIKHQKIVSMLTASGQNIVVPGDISLTDDGVHFSQDGHTEMAVIVRNKLKELDI